MSKAKSKKPVQEDLPGDEQQYSSKIRTVEQTESEADNKSATSDYKEAPSTLGGDVHKHSAKKNKVGKYPLSESDTQDHSEFLQERDLEDESESRTGNLGEQQSPPEGPSKGWGTPHQ